MDLGKELKSKKTLIEENNELRKKIEHFSSNKPAKKYSIPKKISTEFEKELYWSGSHSYMISGVKLQYQKMKESTSHPTQITSKRATNTSFS